VRPAAILTAAVGLALIGAPAAHADVDGPCPGRDMRADRVIEGEFGTALRKSFVMVPFRVPRGTTAIRVKYCWDEPDRGSQDHTLDLGLYEPRRRGRKLWGSPEFRGWGGSSHPDVTLSARGFSRESQYTADPRVEPAGRTTRGFLPGRIRPGLWAAELGVAAVVSEDDGDDDGRVAWRVEVDLMRKKAFRRKPYRSARYDPTPARAEPGWYAGDMHVHAEHSAYGDATMTETFGYAFRPLAEGGAGLDFITLSDYVTGSSWGEVGRYQGRHPGKLIVRSAEVITYRGHTNAHGAARFVDYREGRIFLRRANGRLKRLRGTRDPSALLGQVHRFGGWTQINHPTIFPPDQPGFAELCRGCFWEYSDAETDYAKVDAFEVATGPATGPFVASAIARYDALSKYGIAAVGSSDSHNAGRVNNPLSQSPIGEATTVVYAEELSEPGIECGVEAGHTYVKLPGNDAADLRLNAGYPDTPKFAMMGDAIIVGGPVEFSAQVLGGDGGELRVLRDGMVIESVPVAGEDFTHTFTSFSVGAHRIEFARNNRIEALSTPIWLRHSNGVRDDNRRRDCTPLRVSGSLSGPLRLRNGRVRAVCEAAGGGLRTCALAVRGRGRTILRGRRGMEPGEVTVSARLTRAGARLLGPRAKVVPVRLVFTASDGDGAVAREVRRARLRLPAP